MMLGFKSAELKNLMIDKWVDPLDFIGDNFNYLKQADVQTKTQYVDLNVVLEGDMVKKLSISNDISGLITRSPMLDVNVIELAYKIPTEYKINKKDKK